MAGDEPAELWCEPCDEPEATAEPNGLEANSDESWNGEKFDNPTSVEMGDDDAPVRPDDPPPLA